MEGVNPGLYRRNIEGYLNEINARFNQVAAVQDLRALPRITRIMAATSEMGARLPASVEAAADQLPTPVETVEVPLPAMALDVAPAVEDPLPEIELDVAPAVQDPLPMSAAAAAPLAQESVETGATAITPRTQDPNVTPQAAARDTSQPPPYRDDSYLPPYSQEDRRRWEERNRNQAPQQTRVPAQATRPQAQPVRNPTSRTCEIL